MIDIHQETGLFVKTFFFFFLKSTTFRPPVRNLTVRRTSRRFDCIVYHRKSYVESKNRFYHTHLNYYALRE